MRIGSNISALVAQNNYARAQATIDRSLERMATGKRINRASDDPSGLIAADKLARHRISIEETIKSRELAALQLQAADGALGEIDSMLIDLSAIIVRAANTGAQSTAEREALQIEANSIISGMKHIVSATTVNGRSILSHGAAVEVNGGTTWINSLDVGGLGRIARTTVDEHGNEQTVSYSLGDLLSSGALNLLSGDLTLAQEVAQAAGSAITSMRASIGAQTRFGIEPEVRALAVEYENTVAAESLIRDADLAAETANYVRAEVLRQAAAISLELAQNQARQVLSLLTS
jgi:flagellin